MMNYCRIIIAEDVDALGNVAWMTRKASILHLTSPPIQLDNIAITAAKLQLDYRVIPTTSETTTVESNLETVSNVVTGILTSKN